MTYTAGGMATGNPLPGSLELRRGIWRGKARGKYARTAATVDPGAPRSLRPPGVARAECGLQPLHDR